MAGGRGEGLPVLPVILGKSGGAAAWMICHGRQGRKPGGLPVIDHGSQSPDQDARRDARKKSKKIKIGLAFPGNHAIFSMFVQQGKQGFYLMRDYRTRRNRETGSLPKRIFLFWGIMLACVKPTW